MGIYVNQVGYLPKAKKVAVSTFPCNFQLINSQTQCSVLDGTTTPMGIDDCSGEQVYQIDFSAVMSPGSYYLLAGNPLEASSKTRALAVKKAAQNAAKKHLFADSSVSYTSHE